MAGTKGAGPAIGIDLGTTYSCVAVWRPSHNRVEVIPNDQGNLTTPSCVAFTDTCRLIGDAAMNQAAMNPVNTVFGENHELDTSDPSAIKVLGHMSKLRTTRNSQSPLSCDCMLRDSFTRSTPPVCIDLDQVIT
jgi:molecular chaperone DnaK (HSP70)